MRARAVLSSFAFACLVGAGPVPAQGAGEADQLLDQMQVMLREGLDDHYHAQYETAREKMVQAYVTLLRFKKAAQVELAAARVGEQFGKVTTARHRLEKLYDAVTYQGAPVSLGEIDAARGELKRGLDAVRTALLAAPRWMLKTRLQPYVTGLKSTASWAASTSLHGQVFLESASPYDLTALAA